MVAKVNNANTIEQQSTISTTVDVKSAPAYNGIRRAKDNTRFAHSNVPTDVELASQVQELPAAMNGKLLASDDMLTSASQEGLLFKAFLERSIGYLGKRGDTIVSDKRGHQLAVLEENQGPLFFNKAKWFLRASDEASPAQAHDP